MNVVRLSPASPNADLRALQEVENFSSTDMGWGGEERWTYRILSEEQISHELQRLSQHAIHGPIDCVTFQPCSSYEARSQDRYNTQFWDFPNGRWTFCGVFDGHGSHGTVDYIAEHLPSKVKNSLQIALANGTATQAGISRIMSDAIIEIDNSITLNFLRLFSMTKEDLSRVNDQEICSIMNHPAAGMNSQNITRCLQGSTAIIALIDPSCSHLWLANLGDCRAVLVSKPAGATPRARRISDIHNGSNKHELRRIRDEHPGEPECVLDDRVLGFLAPTRALGDTWMKLPAVYSRKILMQTKEFWAVNLSEEYIERNKTPPYVSNVPQTSYHQLSRDRSAASHMHGHRRTSQNADVALVLCSDGLTDLYEEQDLDEKYFLKRWATIIGESLTASQQSLAPPSRSLSRAHHGSKTPRHSGGRPNLALRLLRDAIGGDDAVRASANLTVEMDERWIDDTTVLVVRFV